MHNELIEYAENDTELEGYLCFDPTVTTPRPGVIVAHAWGGRDAFAEEKAEALARLGYVGFAIDVYGKGVLGSGPEENAKFMQPLVEDRVLLRRRLGAALNTLRHHDMVDPHRIGAIGFCFGGLCVLDLARSGAEIGGVVAFHGLLEGAPEVPNETIRAKVLVLHGYDDPFAPPEQLAVFCREMTEANADWQVHVYGQTQHAFTNPAANDPKLGTAYDEAADRRSWLAMQGFFEEVLR